MGYGPFEHITVEVAQGILVLTLNRPAIKNAFSSQTYLEVAQVFREAKTDEEVHVVILTGAGNFFSAGADMTTPSNTALDEATDGFNSAFRPVGVFMSEVMHFPKPLIAAVNGPAVGVGVTVLLHADISYCTADTYFWTPFSRIAVVPEFVSSMLLPEILGPSRANEMLLANRQLTAKEAHAAGLVSEVYPTAAELLAAAKKTAAHMLSFPLADKSLPLYKSALGRWRLLQRLIKNPLRMQAMEYVHRTEMDALTERINNGDIATAAMQFMQSRGKSGAPKL